MGITSSIHSKEYFHKVKFSDKNLEFEFDLEPILHEFYKSQLVSLEKYHLDYTLTGKEKFENVDNIFYSRTDYFFGNIKFPIYYLGAFKSRDDNCFDNFLWKQKEFNIYKLLPDFYHWFKDFEKCQTIIYFIVNHQKYQQRSFKIFGWHIQHLGNSIRMKKIKSEYFSKTNMFFNGEKKLIIDALTQKFDDMHPVNL